MRTYIIKLKRTNSEENVIHRKQFLSFPDAATGAYIMRAKLGSSWIIDSVAEEQC